jgi:hypothetical protein
MVAAYTLAGISNVILAPILANAPPTANFRADVGQEYLDRSTTPPTLYFYNGQTWVTYGVTGGGGTFATLAVTGAFSAGSSAIAGNETVAGNLTVTGLSTLTGGINTAPVVVAAGASPQTVNARSGQVTFSGVSIASGAAQTFVINNTNITGAGTVILYSMTGATQGSAITMESVTNAAGTSTIVVTNGTSTTMVTDVANVTFTFLVLN